MFDNIDTIIFDKDGTLIDFDAFWISVTKAALRDVFDKFFGDKLQESIVEEQICEILGLLGVKNGETDIDGILCKGTYEQIAETVYKILKKCGYQGDFSIVNNEVLNAYNANVTSGDIKPVCDNLKVVLEELKTSGKHLCVVTTDNPQITNECLKKLGIVELFDRIYTDDGRIATKPSADCVEEYCRETGISRNEIVMVGDTMTDIKFARNAGISVIAVGKEKNRKKLEAYADATIADVSCIFEMIAKESL